jgi:hypothetical protein
MNMQKSTRLVMAVALVLLLVGSGITYETKASGPRPVELQVNKNSVLLRSASIDVRFADNLRGNQQLPVDGGYYLVHFKDKLGKDTASRFVLAVSQGNIKEHIGYSTYLCRLSSAQMDSLNSMKEIDWIGPWKSEYKISPEIYETITTTTTSEGMAFDGDAAPEFNEIPQPENEFVVTFFKGENSANYIPQIRAMGGDIHNYTAERMYVHLDKAKVTQLAGLNGVYFVERRYLMAPVNDNDTWIVQTYQLGNRKVFNNGITGSGQVVAISDTGIDADHLMFWDSVQGLPSHTYNAAQRKVLVYYNWYQTGVYTVAVPYNYYNPGDGYYPGAADPMYTVYDWDIENPIGTNYAAGHGTHTSGTIAGEWVTGTLLPTWGITPTAGYDFYEGNAFQGKLVFQDLGRSDSPYVYGPPDLNDPTPAGTLNGVPYPGTVGLFPQAMADGAYIHSNSWGGGAYGAYDAYSRDIDEMMWANKNFLVVFSNGNDGPGTTTITPPATAKDCLSAGASETSNDGYGDNSNDVASFSSWGPCGGWGRIKPDVCAPGQIIFSGDNNNVTDGTSPNDGLVGFQGTSMAAPGLAGCCALVRQYFVAGSYNPVGASTGFQGAGAFTPSAAMMKAVIINSAQPMTGYNTGGTIPGDGQGWGRVLLDNALYFSGDTQSLLVDDNTTGLDGAAIVQPFFKAYTVSVGPGGYLDVTAVYTDPPGTAGSAFQMVNYMYVEVDHPNGITYYLSGSGNFSGGWTVPNTAFIYPDTVQKVRINNPTPGLYTIYVVAFQTDQVTPGWNVQPYALSVSGNIVQSQGMVQFDQDYYQTTDTLGITLTDADLAGTGTAGVVVTSSATGDSESVTLNETGGASGIFQGTLNCVPGIANPGNNQLEVSDPDTLTVTYNDASPAGTRTDTAQIDGVPPVISNVAANTCNGSSVEITWDTDENSSTVVHWGTTTAYGNTVSDTNLVLSHYVEFDGLQMGGTYYYEVCSTDQAGNTGCSGPYSFTTPMIYTPAQYHAGYVAETDYGVVLDDDDMWTGHNTSYAGTRNGVFQFSLSNLPPKSYIQSVQVVIFKQADQLDSGQSDTWSCNLIDFSGDLYLTGTVDNILNAPILCTLTPTWTTAQLLADGSGTMYTLTISDPSQLTLFNKSGCANTLLTFRLEGATTGDSIMSWDTGFRQDLGSLGVCYKPQLIITYDDSGTCERQFATPQNPSPSLCPLAKYNIQQTLNLKEQAESLLDEALGQGLDTSAAEELMKEAQKFLEIAQQFCAEGSNCVAGNWNVLKAMQLYKEAIDELKGLLGR